MSDAPPQAPDPAPPRRPGARYGLLALAATLALGAALWFGGVLPRPAPPAPPDPATLVAERLATPEYASFFETLAARFPAESAQLKESFAARAAADPAAAGPDRFVANALKNLRETRGVVAAKADAPAMARVFEAQGAMIAALRAADAKLCVDFVYGGASDAFMAFASANRAPFAAVARANLDAILDGAQKKIERERPTDEDFAALEAALRAKGMGDAEIAALLDGKTPDPPLPDERMCEAAGAYVAAMLALPEPARARIMALAIELMARS
jgi:hypothetical protein